MAEKQNAGSPPGSQGACPGAIRYAVWRRHQEIPLDDFDNPDENEFEEIE